VELLRVRQDLLISCLLSKRVSGCPLPTLTPPPSTHADISIHAPLSACLARPPVKVCSRSSLPPSRHVGVVMPVYTERVQNPLLTAILCRLHNLWSEGTNKQALKEIHVFSIQPISRLPRPNCTLEYILCRVTVTLAAEESEI